MHSMEESLRKSLTQAMSAKADFEAGENPGTYRRDVDAWRQLVSHPFMTADRALRGEVLGYLGVLYLHGYDHFDDQAGLDEAIRCLTGSLEVSDVPLITLELGDALAKRQRRDGRREDLDAAIDRLGLVLSPQELRQRDYYLDVLGQMLVERYYQSGSLADLTAAIRAFSGAVQTAPGSAGRFDHLVSLGHALLDRGNRTGQIADLRQAVAVLTEARSLALTGSEEESRVLMILGGAYGELGRQSGQRTDLDVGVQMTEAAAAISASGPEGPYLLANLAGALYHRYGQGRDPADLDRAIELFDRSLKQASPGTRSHVMRLQGLATALADRAEISANRDQAQADWRRAVEYFRAALASARSGPADLVLGVAQPWLTKAADRLDWTAAAEAAIVLVGEMRLAVLAQGSRDDQRTEILTLAKWPAIAAFALATTGRTEDAVTALDQGRVQLLTAALDRDRADMARLTAAGQAALAAEYRRIAAEMAAHEAQDRSVTLSDATDRSSQQRRLRAELEDVLARIRHVPGYERFQAPAAYPDIAAAAAPSPLVYLFTTRFGGMALVVRSASEPPVAVPVPALAGDTAVEQLGTYFWAYNRRAEQPQEWSRAVGSVTRWAFEVIAPVLDYLTASRMVLIPCGPLALLPLHAAWRPDPDQPSGRRYLLDDMTITYAASARLLAKAGSQPARGRPGPGGGRPEADQDAAASGRRLRSRSGAGAVPRVRTTAPAQPGGDPAGGDHGAGRRGRLAFRLPCGHPARVAA